MKQRCSICRQPVRADCDYNQGRCPHRPSIVIKVPGYRKMLYILSAPVIISVWTMMNLGRVWAQVKKDWNIR